MVDFVISSTQCYNVVPREVGGGYESGQVLRVLRGVEFVFVVPYRHCFVLWPLVPLVNSFIINSLNDKILSICLFVIAQFDPRLKSWACLRCDRQT